MLTGVVCDYFSDVNPAFSWTSFLKDGNWNGHLRSYQQKDSIAESYVKWVEN